MIRIGSICNDDVNRGDSWTQKHGQYREGDPDLHDYVGTMFYHGKFRGNKRPDVLRN